MGRPVPPVVYICAAVVLVNVVHSLTTGELLPYGDGAGDANLHDSRETVFGPQSAWFSIGGPLQYGDQEVCGFSVGAKGYIEVCPNKSGCTNDYIIQPYHYKFKSSTINNTVWYRKTINDNELNLITRQIHKASHVYRSFTAVRGLVATWDRVRSSGADHEGNSTFQAVIVTNEAGKESFAIFSYLQLKWPAIFAGILPSIYTGTGYRLPGSDTIDTSDTVLLATTSNTGTPGRWVFRISGLTAVSACNHYHYGVYCTACSPYCETPYICSDDTGTCTNNTCSALGIKLGFKPPKCGYNQQIWIAKGNKLYALLPHKVKSLDAAATLCSTTINGMLPEPRGADENNHLKNMSDLLGTMSEEPFYLGIKTSTDEANEGPWIWNSDQSKVTWFNWGPKQPDGREYEKCVVMINKHNASGLWHDYSCSEPVKIVACQRDSQTTQTTQTPTSSATRHGFDARQLLSFICLLICIISL